MKLVTDFTGCCENQWSYRLWCFMQQLFVLAFHCCDSSFQEERLIQACSCTGFSPWLVSSITLQPKAKPNIIAECLWQRKLFTWCRLARKENEGGKGLKTTHSPQGQPFPTPPLQPDLSSGAIGSLSPWVTSSSTSQPSDEVTVLLTQPLPKVLPLNSAPLRTTASTQEGYLKSQHNTGAHKIIYKLSLLFLLLSDHQTLSQEAALTNHSSLPPLDAFLACHTLISSILSQICIQGETWWHYKSLLVDTGTTISFTVNEDPALSAVHLSYFA